MVACCVVLWTACNVTTADAHATLLQTVPASGEQLDEAPNVVRLYFDERVETLFNSLQVFDRNGRRVDIGNPYVIGGGDTLEIHLANLKQGPYIVRWRVNSLDGHQVDGHFGFGVQSPPPTEAETNNLSIPQQSASSKAWALFVKWAALASMTIWMGGMSFWILTFEPSVRASRQTASGPIVGIQAGIRRTFRILWFAAVLFFITESLALVTQGMTFANVSFVGALLPVNVVTVLMKTSYGQWWTLRMLVAFGLLAVCIWKMRASGQTTGVDHVHTESSSTLDATSGLLGGVALLTIPMSGHARAVSRATAVAVIFDWAHLASTVIWIGGLVYLCAVVMLVQTADPTEFLSHLVGRFSKIARICVLVLLITGVYAAWLHIPSWKSFVSTHYGLALLVKLILVMAMLLIAWLNWRRVLPALSGSPQSPDIDRRWAGRFRILITNEAALGIVVLLVVAILTSLPPATAVAMAGPIDLTKPAESMTVNLKLDSTKVGTAHSVVMLRDQAGKIISVKSVTIFARMPDMDMALETIEAKSMPSGSFQADIPLTMVGKWSISVQVAPQQGDAFVTEFQISSSSLQ